jgi:oligosaccharide repeat unit polymerase
MGVCFYLFLCFFVILFYRLNRVKLIDPVSIVLILNFLFPFVLYPVVFSFTFDSFIEGLEYFDSIKIPLLIILIIFVFWIIGFSLSSNKKEFNLEGFRMKKIDSSFAYFLFFVGVILFFITFQISGLSFFSSFADPLGTRFQIINTTGGYHLRNVSLWSMWTGWFLLIVLKLQGNNISILKLIIFFSFVIFLSIPLGQRYQLVFPFIFLILLLKYRNLISDSTIYISGLILVFLVPLLALYRELGRSSTGMNSKDFIDNLVVLSEEKSKILTVIVERYESISWFNKFWIIRDDLKMSFLDSIQGFISLFIPSSFTGGLKGSDVEVYLTTKIVGSQDFGTFSFTSFPEWYLNFGYLGFPIMGLFSGFVVGKIVNGVRKLGLNVFYLALFADGFFLKLPFININFNSNVSIIYHLIYAFSIFIMHKFYLKLFDRSRSNLLYQKEL